ncbi:hypothetical protein C8N35_11287 [Breoghania corrubedonensis]|uniref:DUF4405 domain-containing protein n=1 Tax=Breoghania corrubedonensis TaxID=665038 RepID=A0A2T5UWA7_9HYPH|nr:DUF4405 domain-containing protein [Breoghania corrubedonensis]PTW55762.1 hypothetical protein C8N35_11287 [Breoghania corrubedonensis]
MPAFLSRYATPLTTGLFLVSLISGIALFFHWGSGLFHGMHEWLSMVLILPFVLHIWKNWRPFFSYFKRPAMGIALALSVVAAVAFMVPSGSQSSGNPMVAVLGKLQASSVETVAPVFGHTGESLAEALKAKGYTVTSTDVTLNDVAKASGKTGFDLARTLGSI